MGEVATIHQPRDVEVLTAAPSPAAALMPADMAQAVELAKMMSQGKLVPAHLQASPADCLMVIEQAARWRMSPFAVAQATSSVKGKLMFEGKLVAAAIHNSGILHGRLSYTFTGEGAKRTVTVTGHIRGDAQPRTVEVTLENVVTDNGCWKKQPDQQLCYSGARVWARRHAPEVMLGVYTPEEEFDDDPPPAPQVSLPRARAAEPASQQATQQTGPQAAAAQQQDTGAKAPQDAPAAATTGHKNALSEGQVKTLRARLELGKITEEELLHAFGLKELAVGVEADINAMLGWAKKNAKD